MTGEEFTELYLHCPELRQYIVDTAKRRSRRKELQEEYVQEAWLVISTAPSGYESTCYYELAEKAIYSSYWQQNKDRLMQKNAVITGYGHQNEFDINEELNIIDKDRIENWGLPVDTYFKMKKKKYGVGDN